MNFGLARPIRIKVQYFRDCLPGVKLEMTFSSHDSLNAWINEHPDYTILQMLIRYRYEKEDTCGKQPRQNHADRLHRVCTRGAMASRKVSGETAPDNRLL